nr:hypothetical protein Iba_chr01aCG3340 [Ipomoea batatas]
MVEYIQVVSVPEIDTDDRNVVITTSNLPVLTPEEDVQAEGIASIVQLPHEQAVLPAEAEIHLVDDVDEDDDLPLDRIFSNAQKRKEPEPSTTKARVQGPPLKKPYADSLNDLYHGLHHPGNPLRGKMILIMKSSPSEGTIKNLLEQRGCYWRGSRGVANIHY